jgi:hypothetical protein
MYDNGKMRPDETIPVTGGGRKRIMMKNMNSTIYYKNVCKCHNVQTTMIKYNNVFTKK